MSVRIMAAGAVFVVSLGLLTVPARACDDRFIKKCEKAAAAAFTADEAAVETSARRSTRRVKVVGSRRSRHAQVVRRREAPRFAARRAERFEVAQNAEPRRAVTDTPMSRRFRGFISPQPIAQNAFETLRKPHAAPNDFDLASILPVSAGVENQVARAEPAAAANIATAAKQDKLISKPTAMMDLASAESKPVVLPPLPAVKPEVAKPEVAKPEVAKPEVANPAVAKASIADIAITAAPTVVSEAPPTGPKPSPFSIHGLVLALCGALGAASALRFIVGA